MFQNLEILHEVIFTVENIKNYLDFLINEKNLYVTLHGAGINKSSLAPYNIHTNPYCLYVKSFCENWDECIKRQSAVYKKCVDGAFFGSCYCGVGEYVFPVSYKGKTYGFVSVSGYKGSVQKRNHAADKYTMNGAELKKLYSQCLSDEIPDIKSISTLIEPLCAMLVVNSFDKTDIFKDSENDYIYGHICSILNAKYAEKLSISEIAKSCHCSESYASHIFKKISGKTINGYLTEIRIAKAKTLLENSGASLSNIAFSIGFSDSNYFNYVFAKNVGTSPGKYRKMHRGAKNGGI